MSDDVVDVTQAGTRSGRRSRRAAALVEATAPPVSAAAVVDALTGAGPGDGAPRVVMVPLGALAPHPGNPRRDLGDLGELADSIRAHGVRQHLLAVPNPDLAAPEEFRVVIGHRRLAAAALAGRSAVPVVVDEHLDEVGQLELMLLENLQRSDLSPIEEADGYQGLLDLGLSAAQIARSTGRAAATVRSRLRLRGLSEGAQAAIHARSATLEEAAAVEKITRAHADLGEELQKRLGTAGFAHELAVAKQAVKSRAGRAKVLAELEAAGVQVVDERVGTRLLDLVDDENGKLLRPEEHAACPGHAAWLWESYGCDWHPVYVCLDAAGNGHRDARWRPGKAEEPEAAAEQRRLVLANNKASRAGQEVRQAFIRGLLGRRSLLPEGWATYAAMTLGFEMERYDETAMASGFLGEERLDRSSQISVRAGSRGFAERFLLALALARAESCFDTDFWRGSPFVSLLVRHLVWLETWGYELSALEEVFVENHRRFAPELGDGAPAVPPAEGES